MRPFTCMNSDVPFQQAGPVKSLATIVTGKHVLFSPSNWLISWSWGIVVVVVGTSGGIYSVGF